VKKNKNKLQPVAQQSVRLRLTLIVTGFIFIFGIIFFLYSNLGAPKSSKGNTKKINLDQLLGRATVIRSSSIIALEEKACLQWETSTEKNNDHFLIERSWDGLEYEILGKVKGYGTSLVVHHYKFIDDIPHLGTSLYRLTQYSSDGEAQIFSTHEFIYKLSNVEMKLLQMGPVPFIDELSVLMQFPTNTQLRVELFTIDGKKIWETLQEVSAGRESFRLMPDVRASGIYHMRLSNTLGQNLLVKLIKR